MGEPAGPGCTAVGCLLALASAALMALALIGLAHAIGWWLQ